ncbi:hypothetical protein [uncultured Alsobacter sp.]|uniref:hypothetical protein n=1 Tax=uncultured Alsobacter sp. TaxID=1748258 RepID=UPI0025FC3DA7|nr:hypothetical protein [uncultured Alsobacter sp.]
MKAHAHLTTFALAILAGLAWAPDARAADCVWGQPGYRACVDDLLAKRKNQDGAAPNRTQGETFKTAPARNRPPALTPLGQSAAQPQPTPRMPKGIDATDDNMRGLQDGLARIKRDAERPAIMPQNRDLFQMPGRICPSQGC